MRTGFAAAKEAMDKAKNSGSGFARRLDYFNLKDGESIVVRFLTDEPLTVNFFEYVFDVKGKPQNFIDATDLHSEDPDWNGEDWVKKYKGKSKDKGLTGEWCEPKARERTVALCVLREEAPREEVDGKKVAMSYRDALITWKAKDEKDGPEKEFPARQFLVVKQAYKNFWSQLIAYHMEYETICDRDYKITREGGGTDTVYNIVPKREDPDFDILELQARYGYGTGKTVEGEELTPDHPDRFLYCPMTLEEWAEDHASEKRVRHFLVGDDKKVDGESNGSAATESSSLHSGDDEAQAAPPPEASKDLSDLRARLERHK